MGEHLPLMQAFLSVSVPLTEIVHWVASVAFLLFDFHRSFSSDMRFSDNIAKSVGLISYMYIPFPCKRATELAAFTFTAVPVKECWIYVKGCWCEVKGRESRIFTFYTTFEASLSVISTLNILNRYIFRYCCYIHICTYIYGIFTLRNQSLSISLTALGD